MKVTVRRNRDGTITVKVGRMVEHIGTEGKTKSQVYDAVKYAILSKGGSPDDITLIEILRE